MAWTAGCHERRGAAAWSRDDAVAGGHRLVHRQGHHTHPRGPQRAPGPGVVVVPVVSGHSGVGLVTLSESAGAYGHNMVTYGHMTTIGQQV